jgi:hypothetical protein
MCIKYALRRRNNYKGAEIGIKEKLKETKKSAKGYFGGKAPNLNPIK